MMVQDPVRLLHGTQEVSKKTKEIRQGLCYVTMQGYIAM